MSLEMIIGLLILLVVAVVVIRIFLSQMKGVEQLEDFKKTMKYREFKSDCENACYDYITSGTKSYGARFCSQRFGIPGEDINRNGKVDVFSPEEAGATEMRPICEDGIYCFHIVDCRTETSKITWRDCRQILCNAYYDTYQDWNKANEKVKELVPNPGTCSLPADDNWWELYFGENPCLGGGGTTTTTISGGSVTLQNCRLDKSTTPWSFTCDTNCVQASSVTVIGTDSGETSIQVGPPIVNGVLTATPSEAGTLDTFTCPATWTIYLSCSNPDETVSAPLVCS